MATCAKIICDWCNHILEQSSEESIFKCRECLTKICHDCYDAKAEEKCAGGTNKVFLKVVHGTRQSTNLNQCHSRVNFVLVPNTTTRDYNAVKKEPDFQSAGPIVKPDYNLSST